MNKIRERHITYSEKVRRRKFELFKRYELIYLKNKSSFNCNKLKYYSDEFFKYNRLHSKKLEKFFN